ncbi:MAG TPA: SpoIIE family protein phosphatase [Bryobacteraceae bacterium]|nr:SpoIIE family protein phosphatase [Bryobacteraceae bacterium]
MASIEQSMGTTVLRGTTVVRVTEATEAAEGRRVASALAGRVGFTPEQAGRVALVATETATNILRHGGGGELLVSPAERGGKRGVEILALDNGPGMRDVRRSMEDGYSTGGSSGTGLGAIERLSSECEIYSTPGKGTAVLARVFPEGSGRRDLCGESDLEIGGVAVPMHGEELCGDAWASRPDPCGCLILVADGLGHGPAAAEASARAVQVFREYPDNEFPELIERMHGALRSTRGAAVALARVCTGERGVAFAGVGNISGAVVAEGGTVKQMVSHAGTIGHEYRRVQEFRYAYPEGAVVVLHSDGITTHWSLDAYPGLREHSAAMIAAVLYRDFNRGRDDATVVVVKERRRA